MILTEHGDLIPEAGMSEQEMLDAGLLTAPESLPVEKAPPAGERFTAGAYVQACRVEQTGDPDRPNTVVSEFTATAVVGDKVSGSPLGDLAGADGWVFDVIHAAPLLLPEDKRTPIIATLVDGREIALEGKGDVWMDGNADLVDVKDIRGFRRTSRELR